MHSFLRAIGFGNLKKNKEIDDLLNEVIEKPTRLQVAKDSNGNEFTEFSREFGGCIGITACGDTETTGNLNSIIIIRISGGTEGATTAGVEVEKHSRKESLCRNL